MVAARAMLFRRFDAIYRDQPYLVRMKARLMVLFCLMAAIFTPINGAKLLWLQPPGLGFRFVFTALVFASRPVAFIVLAVAAGMTGFLSKPIKLDELRRTLRDVAYQPSALNDQLLRPQ